MQRTTGILAARLLAVAIAVLLYSAPSYAYLDPGTGSIILQSILAGFAVAMGVLRIYWHRFKAFVSFLTGETRNTESDPEQESAQNCETQDES